MRGRSPVAKRWSAAAAVCVGLALAARAQESQPATAPRTETELPPALVAQLDKIDDFTFDFDKPAYYELLKHVQQAAHPPGHTQPPLVVDDWRTLAERPHDFRGLAVTIEGVVGANRAYTHQRRRELGTVWQLELTGTRPQGCACTVICTRDVGDLPLGATVEITGYFVMMRSYLGSSQRPQMAALLVAAGPSRVSTAKPAPSAASVDWAAIVPWLLGGTLAGLMLAWLLIRRSAAAHRPRDLHALRPRSSAPASLADDLARWADEEDRRAP
jgi:hypothetical protein